MERRGFIYVLVAMIVTTQAFFIIPIVRAANTEVVINEIAAYEKTGCEWIEILNKGSEAVNIEGFKFWEGGVNHSLTIATSSLAQDWVVESSEYAIIAEDADKLFSSDCNYPVPTTGTVFDSSWGTLNESGEEIGLKDSAGNFIEQFTYISAPDHSLERKDASISEYTSANWTEHASGNTFGVANSVVGVVTPPVITPTTTPTSTIPNLTLNEFVSNPNTGESEWIELYNADTNEVNLSGVTIHDGASTIALPTGSIPAQGFFIVTFSSSRLNNDGDMIRLEFASTAIDRVSYGDWDDGNVNDNVPAPEKGQSVARQNNASTWSLTTQLTPGAVNAFVLPQTNEPPPAPPPATPSGGGRDSVYSSVGVGEIVINEFLPNPGDGEEEFVELYNKTSQTITLEGWWVEDGGETKTLLSGTVAPQGFFVLEKPKGNLNNSGDLLILHEGGGREIDRVTYGEWQDANSYDNAPDGGEGVSIARAKDGGDTGNDALDFVLTTTVTKGRGNVISAPTGGASIMRNTGIVKIVLNEMLPNPEGADDGERGEFIEIYNMSSTTIDLTGWSIATPLQRFIIPTQTIAPNTLVLFFRKQTKIILHNSGREEVNLVRPDGSVADKINYSGEVKEAVSYARRQNGKWEWSTTPTPGAYNNLTVVNRPPVLAVDVETEVGVGEEVLFDASDTFDPDDDDLAFRWQFGDTTLGTGVTTHHIFSRAGIFGVVLTVSDTGGNTTTARVSVRVRNRSDFVGGSEAENLSEDLTLLKISEFLPNPIGDDGAEFVEIINNATYEIDLSEWQLDDEEGGSKPYSIPGGTSIGPGVHKVFRRSDTKLALNNTDDSVRLIRPDGIVHQTVAYKDVREGNSYIESTPGKWIWTTRVTAGVANISAASVINKNVSAKTGTTASAIVSGTPPADLQSLSMGQRAQIHGTVAVLPGIFGSQYFYIVATTTGAQIYMNSKAFPVLALGDHIVATGEISQAYGEKRLKIAQTANIVVQNHGEAPVPQEITIVELDEQSVGALVRIRGEVTQRRSGFLYIDDGDGEVKVTIKTGTNIALTNIAEGDTLSVTGIVRNTASGIEILPRTEEDIVLNQDATKNELQIVSGDQKNSSSSPSVAETYLTATAAGLTSIFLGLFAKARGSIAKQFAKRVGGVVIAMVKRKG